MHFEAALAPAERAFLAEVRAFLAHALDAELIAAEDAGRSQVANQPRSEAWIAKLRERRWHVGTWPREYGGAGLSAIENYLFLYEAGLRGAPLISPLGIGYVGPVVMAFGSAVQKAELLPAIAAGRDHWCQGFSEPGAGSDLGAVTTFAEQEGTFTSAEGRVQRFWPALRAPGAARPAWLVLGAVAAELTDKAPPVRAAELFARLGDRFPRFAGLSYESIGTRGALANEPLQLAGD